MPFCSQCGNQVAETARFCISCGVQLGQRQSRTSPKPQPPPSVPPPTPPTPSPGPLQPGILTQPFLQKPAVRWTGIGCAGLICLFLVIAIIGAIVDVATDNSTGAVPSQSDRNLATNPSGPSQPVLPTNPGATGGPSLTDGPTAAPSATLASDVEFCDDADSKAFVLKQNQVVLNNIPRFDRLQTAVMRLKSSPSLARDEMWYNTTESDVRSVNDDGKKLTEAGPVPAPAVPFNEGYVEVGDHMVLAANMIFLAMNTAQMDPSSSWGKFADDAEDTLDDLADSIEEAQNQILHECG